MIKNPLQNIEEFETIGIVLLGVILLAVLDPVSATQQFLAAVLAALVMVVVGIDVWHWRHDHR